jgi:hypothetical protein
MQGRKTSSDPLVFLKGGCHLRIPHLRIPQHWEPTNHPTWSRIMSPFVRVVVFTAIAVGAGLPPPDCSQVRAASCGLSKRSDGAEQADNATASQLVKDLDAESARSGVARIRRDGSGHITGMLLSSHIATERNISVLRYFSSLEELDINCPQAYLSEQGLTSISEVPSLRRLILRGATRHIGRKMGLVLAGLPHLESLRIQEITIDASFISSVLGSESLRRFEVTSTTSMDDNGVLLISKAGSRLTGLDLSNTGITDDSMEYLTRLVDLERVVIRNTAITRAAAQRFRANSKAVLVGVN